MKRQIDREMDGGIERQRDGEMEGGIERRRDGGRDRVRDIIG